MNDRFLREAVNIIVIEYWEEKYGKSKAGGCI